MYCTSCGIDLGTRLPKFCTQCGAPSQAAPKTSKKPIPALLSAPPQPLTASTLQTIVFSGARLLKKPVFKKPEPVLQKTEPVLQEPEPVLLDPKPVLLEPESVLLEPAPVLLEPESVLLEPAPVLLEPESVSQESEPIRIVVDPPYPGLPAHHLQENTHSALFRMAIVLLVVFLGGFLWWNFRFNPDSDHFTEDAETTLPVLTSEPLQESDSALALTPSDGKTLPPFDSKEVPESGTWSGLMSIPSLPANQRQSRHNQNNMPEITDDFSHRPPATAPSTPARKQAAAVVPEPDMQEYTDPDSSLSSDSNLDSDSDRAE
jgi:hypothetical protein